VKEKKRDVIGKIKQPKSLSGISKRKSRISKRWVKRRPVAALLTPGTRTPISDNSP